MRYWKIDFLRGIAVLFMGIFNYSFALSYLGLYSNNLGWAYWWLFPRVVSGLFVVLAGVSLVISYNKSKNIGRSFKRGLLLFSLGLGITFVTYLLFPRNFIFFGILHLIGFSLMLSPLYIRHKKACLVFGIIFLMTGIALQTVYFNFDSLLWLGLQTQSFSTFDYFPVFPWFGLFLISVYAGHKIHRRFKSINQPASASFICFLGRKSLIIYLLHQPLLIMALLALGVPIII